MKKKMSALDTQVMVAKMYYREGCSQEQVARNLNVSRPTVTRILKSCLEDGIVTIHIKETNSAMREAEDRLRLAFNLRKVILVPSDPIYSVSQDRVGAAAAEHLLSVLTEGALIGLSWGTTLTQILGHLSGAPRGTADVIQILGDPVSTSESNAAFMTVSLANTMRGRAYVLPAPMLVQSAALRDMLLSEPHMRELYQRFSQVSVAMLGLGGTTAGNHDYLTHGQAIAQAFREVQDRGAVSDLCGAFFAEDGARVESILDDLTFAMPLAQLKQVPEVIGVACGTQKAQAAVAALRSGYIHTFVLDENLAKGILERIS
ncbi:MAG: winged helix-turn-helix transcriptional regulator [Clostridiales bacterium]|nr:winged helix-turn-helix transcriptional regulator [Clostridiales bacterium]